MAKSSFRWTLVHTQAVLCLAFIALLIAAIMQSIENEKLERQRRSALHAYALKTNGHLEKYQTGTHVESRYSGSIPDGKGGSTSIYTPTTVEDYDYRIVYFDNRPPYYPEDHTEWLAELERIKREEASQK